MYFSVSKFSIDCEYEYMTFIINIKICLDVNMLYINFISTKCSKKLIKEIILYECMFFGAGLKAFKIKSSTTKHLIDYSSEKFFFFFKKCSNTILLGCIS